jgi:hypothetical protein
LLMDSYMSREAPLSDDFARLPRFADKAAPAAICCFFDFAGMFIWIWQASPMGPGQNPRQEACQTIDAH